MNRKKLPMNLQIFAEPSEPPAGGTEPPAGGQQNQAPQFDYEKLASIISGKQSVTEDTVLRNYFKQQGLSEDEAKQAISAFKQKKAAEQPDVGAMQTQLSQAQAEIRNAHIQNAATMEAISIGLDSKTIPYVLKLADFSKAVGQDGKINNEEVKNAINQVLEDVPALKNQSQQGTGFRFGSSGGGTAPSAVDEELDKIFGVKKK